MTKEYYWNRPGLHSSDYGLSEQHNHDHRTFATAENNVGKGPKGYKRKDSTIHDEACEVLFWSPEVDASEVEVEVKDGVVYLRGLVDSRHAKRQAERILEHLPGVEDVQNYLSIKKQLDLEEDKIIARSEDGLFSQEIIQK